VFIEDLPYVLPLANGKIMKRREQTKPNAFDDDQYKECSGANMITGTMACYRST
jgi:hypothetical protein